MKIKVLLTMVLASFALAAIGAMAFAVFGASSDPDSRRLLGMGVIALTLSIALLTALYLPMKRNVDKPGGWLSGLASSSLPLGKYIRRRLLRKTRRRQFYRREASVAKDKKKAEVPFSDAPNENDKKPHPRGFDVAS